MSTKTLREGSDIAPLKVVAFGEALWDILPGGAVLGGAPLNFAFRIGSLGHTTALISCLGLDDWGDRALRMIEDLGMDSRFIRRHPELPTGTVDVVVDERGDPQFTINAPAAYDDIQGSSDLSRLVQECDCLCFGTLIQRAEGSRRTLAGLLESFQNGALLCDINLRKDCYTEQSVRDSLAQADVLKINETELEEVADLLELSGSALPDRVSALIEKADLRCCLVTLGRRGAFAATRAGDRVYGPAYRVPKRDAAGSGDAFTAGFVHQYLGRGDLALACRMGNAMGSLVAGQNGATQRIETHDVEKLIASEDYEEIAQELKAYLQ